MLRVSDQAQSYLFNLLQEQKKGTQIRVFVLEPGTPLAECGICYCAVEDFKESDVVLELELITIRFDNFFIFFLKHAEIDIIVNDLHSQLTIKAPNSKNRLITSEDKKTEDFFLKNTTEFTSLEVQVKEVLDSYVNPTLLTHGGKVKLIKVTEDFVVFLQFSGGCNGCSMVDFTVRNAVENTLRKFFPKLKEIRDVTQHNRGVHSYF